MYNTELLSAIDNITDKQLDAEYNVLESMIQSYDKASIILENYQGDDLSSFDIFSEGFVDSVKYDETNDNHFRRTDKDGKKENIFISILMAIPRLITWFYKKMKSIWDKVPIIGEKKTKKDDLLNDASFIKLLDKDFPNDYTEFPDLKSIHKNLYMAQRYGAGYFFSNKNPIVYRVQDACGVHIVNNKDASSKLKFILDIPKILKCLSQCGNVTDKIANANFNKPSTYPTKELDQLKTDLYNANSLNKSHKFEDGFEYNNANELKSYAIKWYDQRNDKSFSHDNISRVVHKLQDNIDNYRESIYDKLIKKGSIQQAKIDAARDILTKFNEICNMITEYSNIVILLLKLQ